MPSSGLDLYFRVKDNWMSTSPDYFFVIGGVFVYLLDLGFFFTGGQKIRLNKMQQQIKKSVYLTRVVDVFEGQKYSGQNTVSAEALK